MSSTNIDFKLLSLNVRGIWNYDKRKAIFLWISKQNADDIFLQETYSTKEVEHFWRLQWKGEIFFAHGSEHSKGVMILTKEGLDIKISDSQLVFEHFDKLMSLSSKAIYQLTKERVTLLPSAQTKWNQIFSERILIWKDLYIIPYQCTLDTNLREFQFKILHRILTTNYSLYKMSLIPSPVCSFCDNNDESLRHLLACSRRSDSGARAKNKANERAGKKEGRLGPVFPRFFPALSLASFFARTPLSERLEQARHLFVHCSFVSTFWDQILNWNPICRDNFDNLDDNAILFGIPSTGQTEGNYLILNTIILVGKQTIYQCRKKLIKPSFALFLAKIDHLKVPLRRKFVGLFRPKSVAEYRVVSIFTQKTEQEIVHPNIF